MGSASCVTTTVFGHRTAVTALAATVSSGCGGTPLTVVPPAQIDVGVEAGPAGGAIGEAVIVRIVALPAASAAPLLPPAALASSRARPRILNLGALDLLPSGF